MMLAFMVPIASPAIEYVDLNADLSKQTVIDREKGQYLGHVSSVLLEDGKTLLLTYPRGHGRGPIVLKRSNDGGRTWSSRLETPKNWETSLETPTIHRVVDPKTDKKRLILWSGLHPARLSSSEDNGQTWTNLNQVGNWGGIVVMGDLVRRKDKSYAAYFHDDGRFFLTSPQTTGIFTLYETVSRDGGMSWSFPRAIQSASDVHLCEPGLIRSPNGDSMAMLLRENRRVRNSQIMMSNDEGRTWSLPRALPESLTGDRHQAVYLKDGRLLISFRFMPILNPKKQEWWGDWVAWVGTWDDLMNGREGEKLVRLKDNLKGSDCAYPGVEVLPDGTVFLATYGHWVQGEEPFILGVHLNPGDFS